MKPHLFVNCITRLAIFLLIYITIISCSGKNESPESLLLEKGWFIQSSQKTTSNGEGLSTSFSGLDNWYPAEVPSTVFGSLVNNGVYEDVFFGKNLEKANPEDFQYSWWYRTSFWVAENAPSTHILEFDGIIFRANIWLNGIKIASADTVEGAFRLYSFNVSDIITKDGDNFLAVEVFPPVAGDLTVGFFDWNPEASDRGMGIWREVRLRSSGDVSLRYPFVVTKLDTSSLDNAMLTVSCEAINNGSRKISGTMHVNINDEIALKKKVSGLNIK